MSSRLEVDPADFNFDIKPRFNRNLIKIDNDNKIEFELPKDIKKDIEARKINIAYPGMRK